MSKRPLRSHCVLNPARKPEWRHPDHDQILHYPADFRVGAFHHHRACRLGRGPQATDRAISADRAAHRADYRDLSGRQCRDAIKNGCCPNRGTAQRR